MACSVHCLTCCPRVIPLLGGIDNEAFEARSLPGDAPLAPQEKSSAGKEAGKGEPDCGGVLCAMLSTVADLATGRAIHTIYDIGPDDECLLCCPGWQFSRL